MSKAIYKCLSKEYLKAPSTKEQWISISNDFEETWNLPHYLNAMDEKHIHIECFNLSGGICYNYK